MEWLPWIDARVHEILAGRVNVLDHWRRQVLTTSNRVKNFENWMLVELVHHLQQNGVQEIKTNGYLERPSYPIASAKASLQGVKAKSHSISPDLAFRPFNDALLINAEMKTQTSPQEVIDDVRLVRYHNQYEINQNHRSCFLWIVVAPADPKLHDRVIRSSAKIMERLSREGIHIKLKAVNENPWLAYCVAAPGIKLKSTVDSFQ